MNAEALLDTMLPFAVAMNILNLQQMEPDQRERVRTRWLDEAREVLGAHADAILIHQPGYTAEAFNSLGYALAAMAFQPGGVTFGDRHWEV